MSTSRRALQIGWRRRGTDALRKLGYEVDLVVDAETTDDSSRPGWIDGASNVFFVEYSTWSEHIGFLINRLTNSGTEYQAVVGFDEFALMPTWQVTTMLGLPALDWRVVSNLRDKSAQKAVLRAGGVPCAESWLFEDVRRQGEEILAMCERLPLVLKPYSGAGAVNTHVARTRSQLVDAIEQLADSATRTVLVEAFVDGVEHHVDGVVANGRIVTFSLSRYLGNIVSIRDGVTPASVAAPASAEPEWHARARDMVARALELLGLTEGVFHVELFRTTGGWVFSEAAMRVGGCGVALHHETVAGIDLHEAMARAQIGAELSGGPGCNEVGHAYTGWTSLPGPPGMVRGYPDREAVLKAPGVLDVEFDIVAGQRLGTGTTDSVVRVGSAVLTAATEQEYCARQADLVQWFRSRVDSADQGESLSGR